MSGDPEKDIQTAIDEILDALSGQAEKKVNREELEKEFKKFLEYGVPLDHAKQTLLKKYGSSEEKPAVSTERILIVDMQPNAGNVHILCRVLNVNPREVTARGEKRKIFSGILGDESGSASFTAWKDFELGKGDVVEISNAYTREWQGAVQINLGDRTTVEKTDESRIPLDEYTPREYKMSELRAGLGSIEITGRILEISQREVEVNTQKKTVFSGMIGDETGKAQFTSWYDFQLKTGDVVKITGGYVKTWKGVPQLTFDEKAKVEKRDSESISNKDIKAQKLLLHELVEKRGALDVEVEGTVIEIREGSGVVVRCSECRRVFLNDACPIHGKVKGDTDFRVRLVIDDGTGTVSSTLGLDVVEKLLGRSLADWQKLSEQSKDNNGVMQELYTLLFGHRVRLQGNALGDQYGMTIIAKQARFDDIDIAETSEKLAAELEEFG